MGFSQTIQLDEYANNVHFKTSLAVKAFFVFLRVTLGSEDRAVVFHMIPSRRVCSTADSSKSLSAWTCSAVCPENTDFCFDLWCVWF